MSVIGLSGRVEEREEEKKGYIPDIIVVKQRVHKKNLGREIWAEPNNAEVVC